MSLACHQLQAGYGVQPVLNELSLSFSSGCLTALLGANGCGKSTLLKCLAGQLKPETGTVCLHGKALLQWHAKEKARQMAYLPQYPQLFAEMTVFDLVRFGRFPHQNRRQQWQPEDESAIRQALTQTGLTALSSRWLSTLSGGQQQRAWIAMVLAQDSDILLLDEPINHLDLNHQIEIMDLLLDLRDAGKTLVVVMHDLNLASRYADHLVLMQHGQILRQGRATEVITPSLIETAFGQPVAVHADPVHAQPMVIPLGRRYRPKPLRRA